MKVKIRKRKPAPTEVKQPTFRSTIEVLRELVLKCGIPKAAWIERHDKECIRKEPAPIAAEQADKASVNVDFILGNNVIKSERLETDKISEPEFIKMIDKIHYAVHHPRVMNSKTKQYPDVKISELAKILRL